MKAIQIMILSKNLPKKLIVKSKQIKMMKLHFTWIKFSKKLAY
jgi:hypothetical protein